MPEILLLGSGTLGKLERSFASAFEKLGWRAFFWDPQHMSKRYVRGGSMGMILSDFVRVWPWLAKSNRDLVMHVSQLNPRLILSFTHAQISPGALAQMRASIESTLVQFWPDTMLNWSAEHSANLPLYDLIATYSRATVPVFERMGARKVMWMPLAGDQDLHPAGTATKADMLADVSFIGGWRPEREAVLSQLNGFDLKIWGPNWGRRCRRNKTIMRAWQGRALMGSEFAKTVRGSKVNLNIIDRTNHPAANMRFFEISISGGFQLCSPCPEMENEFIHGEHVFYYRHPKELPELLKILLADNALRKRVADTAQQKVLKEHTYFHRAQRLLEVLNLAA